MLFSQKITPHFKPNVSALIPAYNSQEFICETLDSLSKQTFKNFQILISIDRSDDNTIQIIKKWCTEHKNIHTQIFCQAHRLDWVKNINFLLKKCETKYFMILPHDDLIHETYIQKMLQCLEVNPSACVAFSDIQGFGEMDALITQKSIKGDRFERTLEFLIHHYNAVAFRGLVNRTKLSDFMLLSEKNDSNIATDTIWIMQMALMGELIRVPEVLYHKRYLNNSVHAQWWKSGKENAIKAWLGHCEDCLKLICRAGFEKDELIYLIGALVIRLFRMPLLILQNEGFNVLLQLFNGKIKRRHFLKKK